jgi:hypothetical protein
MCGGGQAPPPPAPPPPPAQVPTAVVAEGPAGPLGAATRAAAGGTATAGALDTKAPTIKSLLGQ